MGKIKAAVLAMILLLLYCAVPVQADKTNLNSLDDTDSETETQLDDDFGLLDEFEAEPAVSAFDPLGGYNRFMTGVNDNLYFYLLKPVAKGFTFVIPEPARMALSRCFKNILFPIRLVNNLLQLKIKRAGIEGARFCVNTTIGVLGLCDPAQSWLNLEACDEDFGQTLGHYGVGSGFHLVFPVFGPSNVRDAVGMLPDYFLNPINYIGDYKLEAGLKAFERGNYTSLHLGEYEELKKDALDLYIFLRDAYEQNREMRIEE